MHTILTFSGRAKDWMEAISLCGGRMVEAGCVAAPFVDECIEREKEYPTGIPTDIPIAMPHVKSGHIARDCMCLLRLDEPVEFFRMDSRDECVATRLVFNLAITDADNHQDFLERFMEMIQDEALLRACLDEPLDDVLAALQKQLSPQTA